ncbi:putative uncharacterized protein DDB_G0282133 isoform X2 [Gordionus sp. m RMFG-2023]|uniref:putative uncharacterized protein DDB_G0282133 isoform X2 n=1 Tax=Gordionus sp. m RMFG-2023 TaxID=3053472 RepID=UPI0031FC432A
MQNVDNHNSDACVATISNVLIPPPLPGTVGAPNKAKFRPSNTHYNDNDELNRDSTQKAQRILEQVLSKAASAPPDHKPFTYTPHLDELKAVSKRWKKFSDEDYSTATPDNISYKYNHNEPSHIPLKLNVFPGGSASSYSNKYSPDNNIYLNCQNVQENHNLNTRTHTLMNNKPSIYPNNMNICAQPYKAHADKDITYNYFNEKPLNNPGTSLNFLHYDKYSIDDNSKQLNKEIYYTPNDTNTNVLNIKSAYNPDYPLTFKKDREEDSNKYDYYNVPINVTYTVKPFFIEKFDNKYDDTKNKENNNRSSFYNKDSNSTKSNSEPYEGHLSPKSCERDIPIQIIKEIGTSSCNVIPTKVIKNDSGTDVLKRAKSHELIASLIPDKNGDMLWHITKISSDRYHKYHLV